MEIDFDVQPIPTNNREWGFYGTINGYRTDDGEQLVNVDEAWNVAFSVLGKGKRADQSVAIREALDSSAGRHFADRVNEYLEDGVSIREALQSAWNSESWGDMFVFADADTEEVATVAIDPKQVYEIGEKVTALAYFINDKDESGGMEYEIDALKHIGRDLKFRAAKAGI